MVTGLKNVLGFGGVRRKKRLKKAKELGSRVMALL